MGACLLNLSSRTLEEPISSVPPKSHNSLRQLLYKHTVQAIATVQYDTTINHRL